MIDFESAPGSGSGGSGSGRSPRFGVPGAGALGFSKANGPGGSATSALGAPGATDEAPPSIPAFIDALNERQREAALHTEGPLIVLAGAGSGKTKMLTSRIAYLIEGKRVPAHHILAVTFTNKAAGEMRERVEKMLGVQARSAPWGGGYLGVPEIGTFHSVCVRLLRREAHATPFTQQFVIYDDSDQLSLVKTAMEKIGIDEKSINPKGVQGAINRYKCDALEPQEIQPAPHDIFGRQVKRVYEQYQKDLFANNALDFGEIICMTYRILRDNEEVRRKYQARFRYLHVDEYQDTNRAQYLLLSMLASKRHGGHENICVVGDEDQSIYKWRGADIRNILDFEQDYPGSYVVKLEQNYRSTQTIIKAAGHVIRNNVSRKDKTLWTDNEEGLPVVRAQVADERAEAELAISELKRLAENEGRTYGDFAVFYRTNAQSRQFEDVLRREKIPYQIVGGLKFYDRKEIKDVMSYLKVVMNPSDSVSFKRILNVPARGIGKTTAEKLDAYQAAESISYWETLQRAASDSAIAGAAAARKLAQFTQLLRRLMDEQPKLLLSELYHLVLDETGYVRELRNEGTEEALARIENLEEFDTLLLEFEEQFFEREQASPEQDREERKKDLLPTFIEQSSLASEADNLDGYASSVKMMTLHSSKGLEFPVVFMVGMEEGLFPSIKPWEETPDEDIEEERRLCYVGMTRAREQLYMLHVVVRRIWGNVAYNEPSRFFDEIPSQFVDFRDLARGGGFGSGGGARSGGSGYGESRSYEKSFAGSSSGPRVPAPAMARHPSQSRAPGSEMAGTKINHPEYGPGTILQVEGSGDQRKVTIEFRGRERRKFLVRYIEEYLEEI